MNMNENNSYRTPFERSLELGLHAHDLTLSAPDEESGGGLLVDEYIPLLISNVDCTKGQFSIIRKRRIKTERFMLEHLLLFQQFNQLKELEGMNKEGTLYELLSVWLPPPSFLELPNFELSACANNWYLDTLEAQKGKQSYDPGKMTLRTLGAIQIHGRIDLPKKRTINFEEID